MPHCDAETDTAHVLRCQHYTEAVGWLWAVAESLGLEPTAARPLSDLWAELLGGVPPTGVSGARARVWERLRLAFLSALYRDWTSVTRPVCWCCPSLFLCRSVSGSCR